MQNLYASDLRNNKSTRDAVRYDKTLCVACFNLQTVLATLQSNVNDFQINTQLIILQYRSNYKGFSYVWHEETAKRSPNQIASCLWKFLTLQKSKTNIKSVIFCSDNYGGKNRNKFIIAINFWPQ